MQSILKCCSRKGHFGGDAPRIMIDSQIIEEEEILELSDSKSVPREKPQQSFIQEQAPSTEPIKQDLFTRSQSIVEKNLKELGLNVTTEEFKQPDENQKPQDEIKNTEIEDILGKDLFHSMRKSKDESAFMTESLAKSLGVPLSSQESKISQMRESSVIEPTMYQSAISKHMGGASQVENKEPTSRKTNPFSRNASMVKQSASILKQNASVLKENPMNMSQLQTSIRSIKPTEQVYAERYGLKVTEQDLNELRTGSSNLGPVLNFYLRYLEEKTTQGIQVPKIQLLKGVTSDFYRTYVLEKSWNHETKFFRYNPEPVISHFERIIFLVHIKLTDRWYLAVYDRSKKILSIMTPEEKKKQLTATIREVLNWSEKREIANNILRYFDHDFEEKMNKPLPLSAIAENYLTDLPLCTKPENYGFHVLEMMRRVFYDYDLNAEFTNDTVEKFKLRFCEFIRFFGKQPEGSPLLADPFI